MLVSVVEGAGRRVLAGQCVRQGGGYGRGRPPGEARGVGIVASPLGATVYNEVCAGGCPNGGWLALIGKVRWVRRLWNRNRRTLGFLTRKCFVGVGRILKVFGMGCLVVGWVGSLVLSRFTVLVSWLGLMHGRG